MFTYKSNLHWGRVILGVALAFGIAYGSSLFVVTGYATLLAFQVRGAPDMALINTFAASYAGPVTSIFIGLGTLLGGRFASRHATDAGVQPALAVGLLTAVIDIALSLVGGFSLLGLVSFLLALGGGWLGGKLVTKQTQPVVNSVV